MHLAWSCPSAAATLRALAFGSLVTVRFADLRIASLATSHSLAVLCADTCDHCEMGGSAVPMGTGGMIKTHPPSSNQREAR